MGEPLALAVDREAGDAALPFEAIAGVATFPPLQRRYNAPF